MLNHSVYYNGYVTKKIEYGINSVKPLYLMINRIKGHFEEKDGDKYLAIKKFLIEIIKKVNDYS